MNKMRKIFYLLCILIQMKICGASYCTDDSVYPSYMSYCDYDCCGSYPYEYCCESTDYPASNVSVIVGIAVGSSIGGIILISVIICVICVCIKQQGKQGRIIGPVQTIGTTQQTIFTTTTSYPSQWQGQGGYFIPMNSTTWQPPAYGQSGYSLPTYNATPSAAPQTGGNTGF